MADDPNFMQTEICGYLVSVDMPLGHLWVLHDGRITWDQLQRIKNEIWGTDTRAIEVYPAQRDLVNTQNCRHLWRLGPTDFAPDLLGNDPRQDSLAERYAQAWAEAREVGA